MIRNLLFAHCKAGHKSSSRSLFSLCDHFVYDCDRSHCVCLAQLTHINSEANFNIKFRKVCKLYQYSQTWYPNVSAAFCHALLFLARSWYVFNVVLEFEKEEEDEFFFHHFLPPLLACVATVSTCLRLQHIQLLCHWLRFERTAANKIRVEII